MPASAWATGDVAPKPSLGRSESATSDATRSWAGGANLAPATRTLARKSGKAASDGSGESTGAQARKGRAGDDSAAKSDGTGAGKESGAKSGGSGSGTSLDSLMTDVVSDTKGKKRDTREIDALLKDVQKKNDSAPVVKKEEPPAAPPLSPAEISAAMAQLKVRGNACAQRLGRGGTAELKITVSKEGKVTDVKLAGKLVGTPVATCIEQAAKAITFRSNAGLRFDYRMDVR